MRPVLFSIFGLDIQTYGLSKAAAALIAAYLLGRAFSQLALKRESAHFLVLWATIWGFVGAKIYYLLENLDALSWHRLGGTGFTWFGGLIAGVVAALVVIRRHRLPLAQVAGASAVPLSVAYGVGRLGCLLAGDGTYGKPSGLPWAMSFPHGAVPSLEPVHPTPLYEALAAFAIAAVLWWARRRMPGVGLFGAYLILSGLARFAVEFLRVNAPVVVGLTQPQLWSVLSVAVGAVLVVRAHRSPTSPSRRTHALAGIGVAVMLALVATAAPADRAVADSVEDRQRAAQQRADSARQQYEQLQESVEDLSADLAQAVLTLEETKARLPAVQVALDAATAAADSAQRAATLAYSRLEDTTNLRRTFQDELDRDSARRTEVRSTVAQLARSAYQGAGSPLILELAVGARSLDDFVSQAENVATAQRLQSRALEELVVLEANALSGQVRLDAVVDTLAELEEEAVREAAAAEAARTEELAQSEALRQAIADQSAAAQRMEGMRGQAQAEQAAVDSIRAAAEAEIAQIAAAAEGADGAPPTPGAEASAPGPPAAGGVLFANPTSIDPMYVTSNYGMRLHPILGYYRLHAGIDLRTYCNTPLYAPRDGTVQWSEWRSGFGNQVMLNYGTVDGQSLMSSSNHLARSVVSDGQQVKQGQLIGYSGNTGLSGGCHLHFEVYVSGKTVDPAPLLGLR